MISGFSDSDKQYKCGELSVIVVNALKKILQKINHHGLKKSIKFFLPEIDIDEFVLSKLKTQMNKRRIVTLNGFLGRVDVQYRRDGVKVEPYGILRMFIRQMNITDSKIIDSFDNILSQIEKNYINDHNYVISKVDEIIFEFSKTGLYKPKNSEEKTLYDLITLILVNYYHSSTSDIPEWIKHALNTIKKGEFVEKLFDMFADYLSEIISQVSENIFFDFKFTFESFWLRRFLNKKTNRGQLSKLIGMLGIDINGVIKGFVKDYLSPSFIKGFSDIMCDIASDFLSDFEQISSNSDEIIDDIWNEDINDLTVTLHGKESLGRAFRWYTKKLVDCEFQYSSDANFESYKCSEIKIEKVSKTFPVLNLGPVSNYKLFDVYKYSTIIKNINISNDVVYYRILINKSKYSETYKLNTKNNVPKDKIMIFADSQGMVKHDYEVFLDLLEKSVNENSDSGLIVHLGDFVDDGNNEEYWKWILESDVWKKFPVIPVSGNHEARQSSLIYGKNMGSPIYEHFNISEFVPQSLKKGIYYSKVYGDITFIILNTNPENSFMMDNKQYKWAIETAKKAKTKWKILLTHKSPYSNGPHHKDIDVKMIGKQINDIAYYGGIDLVIGGHDHVYVRTPVMAQNCKVDCDEIDITYNGEKYKLYEKYFGSVFVVPGTSGVKNYKQCFPIDFCYEKIIKLNCPTFSTIKIHEDNLYFDSFSYDFTSKKTERIDGFSLSKKNILTHEHDAADLDKIINSIPDIPWKSHGRYINQALKIYSSLEYREKIKVKKHMKLVRLLKSNISYQKITKGNISIVKSKKEFIKAIENSNVSTIITNTNEINFESKMSFSKKIFIDRPLCIRGNAKLTHVEFILSHGAQLILKDCVCIDNSRKPISIKPSADVFTMMDDTVLILSDDSSINNGYGIGFSGYAINVKGENVKIYLNSSGHSFASKGFVFSNKNSCSVKIMSGKYNCKKNLYAFNIIGKIHMNGGFVSSIKVAPDSEMILDKGIIGDKMIKINKAPIDCSGKLIINSGTINSHSGVSVLMRDGSELVINKGIKEHNFIDIKGKILYN